MIDSHSRLLNIQLFLGARKIDHSLSVALRVSVAEGMPLVQFISVFHAIKAIQIYLCFISALIRDAACIY